MLEVISYMLHATYILNMLTEICNEPPIRNFEGLILFNLSGDDITHNAELAIHLFNQC